MRRNTDFRQRGEALWNAMRDTSRTTDAKRLWDDMWQQLQDVLKPEPAGESASGIRKAVVAQGETVLAGYSVTVIDNVAYAANGSDVTRQANGVVVGSDRAGEVLWVATGDKITARVRRNTGVAKYGALYQSVNAGVLTNDPDEAGLAFVQQVGHFERWVMPMAGSSLPDLAEITLNVNSGGVIITADGLRAFTPTFIAADETFTVPADRQVLFALPIDNEGTLEIDGALVLVDEDGTDGVLGPESGGTGMTSLANGALYVGNGAGPVEFPGNKSFFRKFLVSSGTGFLPGTPSWTSISVADVSGTLQISQGGTGVTTGLAGLMKIDVVDCGDMSDTLCCPWIFDGGAMTATASSTLSGGTY